MTLDVNLHNARIGVVGLGYVGLPLAVEFGKHYPTIGFDINAARVAEWIEEAKAGGARVLAGGPRDRAICPPTLIEGARRDAKVVREEVFGPVIVIEEVASLEEALARAGDTRFGLQAGIFTNDVRALMRAWETLEVGGIIHNDVPAFRVDLMPYGGVRDSGQGREGPRYTVEEMTEPRLLVIKA